MLCSNLNCLDTVVYDPERQALLPVSENEKLNKTINVVTRSVSSKSSIPGSRGPTAIVKSDKNEHSNSSCKTFQNDDSPWPTSRTSAGGSSRNLDRNLERKSSQEYAEELPVDSFAVGSLVLKR